MFEIGERVEVNVCLGEMDYGITPNAYKEICKRRSGFIKSKDETNYRVVTSCGTWYIPKEYVNRLESTEFNLELFGDIDS